MAMNPRAAAANRAAQIVRTARPAWRKASRRLAAAASAAARKLAGAIRRRPAAILAGAWAAMLMGAALTIPLLLVSPAGVPEGNLGTTGAHHLEDAWGSPPQPATIRFRSRSCRCTFRRSSKSGPCPSNAMCAAWWRRRCPSNLSSKRSRRRRWRRAPTSCSGW